MYPRPANIGPEKVEFPYFLEKDLAIFDFNLASRFLRANNGKIVCFANVEEPAVMFMKKTFSEKTGKELIEVFCKVLDTDIVGNFSDKTLSLKSLTKDIWYPVSCAKHWSIDYSRYLIKYHKYIIAQRAWSERFIVKQK